jgi:Flp pilus assembly protein TadG
MTRSGDDEGSVVLETVILAPILILLLATVIATARLTLTRQRVDAIASQAARAAATATTPGAATRQARDAGAAAMRSHDLECADLQVSVDLSNFHPDGQVKTVVRCTADLGTGVPGLAGRRTVTGSSTQIIERFREITP